MHLPILHLSRVELRCKLQEKLHRVTGPLVNFNSLKIKLIKIYYANPSQDAELIFGTIGIGNNINNMATRNIYSFKNNTRANRLYAFIYIICTYTPMSLNYFHSNTSFFDLEHHITFSPQNLWDSMSVKSTFLQAVWAACIPNVRFNILILLATNINLLRSSLSPVDSRQDQIRTRWRENRQLFSRNSFSFRKLTRAIIVW